MAILPNEHRSEPYSNTASNKIDVESKLQPKSDLSEKTLEQLTQKLRKVLTAEDVLWLDELTNRAQQTQIDLIETKYAELDVLGDKHSFSVNALQHMEWLSVVLLRFPPTALDVLEICKSQGQWVMEEYRGGFHVLASKDYDIAREKQVWRIGLRKQDALGPGTVIDHTKAESFVTFANAPTKLTREGLVSANRRLKAITRSYEVALRQKNLELDALHYVWCTGSCGGGQHRYHRDLVLTEEMLKTAEGLVKRMRSRGSMERRFWWVETIKGGWKFNPPRLFSMLWWCISWEWKLLWNAGTKTKARKTA